jgi:hypothetical protein
MSHSIDEEFFEKLPIGALVYTRECNNLSPFFVMMKISTNPDSPQAVIMPKYLSQGSEGKNDKHEVYTLVSSNLCNALSTACTGRDGSRINQRATKNILAAVLHVNNVSPESSSSVEYSLEMAAKYAQSNASKNKQYTLPLYGTSARKNFEQVMLFQHGIEESCQLTHALTETDFSTADKLVR